MEMERFISGEATPEDVNMEVSLRPKMFDEFPGQDKVKQKLLVFTSAAKKRGEPLDHTLLCGPPGLGKTTRSYSCQHFGARISSRPADLRFIAKAISRRF